MRADSLKSLSSEAFDLLVVGAGIHGAAAAWSAARMGLKTALIDADDFGGATSANSLKVIHGGMRYLQHGNLARMRESILARRRFLLLAPELVKPQAFAVPTYGSGVRSRAALRIALTLNDLISADRNFGVDAEHRIPRGRILSRREAAELWPALPAAAYDGAALWCDALAHDTERLTLSFALSAHAAGATIANYVRAIRLVEEVGAVSGAEVRDELSGGEFAIRARAVLNAAGPWWQRWIDTGSTQRPLVGAWNIIVRRRWFGDVGVGLESTHEHRDGEALVHRGRRNLFFVPWREGTMIGTVYEPFVGDPSDYRPRPSAIEAFLREINTVLPDAKLTLGDITRMHVGVQPASTAQGSPEPDKHSAIAVGPRRGLFSIKGVKYTTGLTVGERAARMIARAMRKSDIIEKPDHLTGSAPLRGSIRDQVRHAVRHEYVVHLSDFVLRRSGMGTFAPPEASALEVASRCLAEELGWTESQRASELEFLESFYRRFTPS